MSQEKSIFLEKRKKTSGSEKVTFITFWLLFPTTPPKDQENGEGKGKRGDKGKAEEPQGPNSSSSQESPCEGQESREAAGEEGKAQKRRCRIQGGQRQRSHSASHTAGPRPTRDHSSIQRPKTTLLISFCKAKRLYPWQRVPRMCVLILQETEEYRLTCQFMTINRIKILVCLSNKNFIFHLNI